ncbi:hypothetical protein BCM14_2182 [Jezberella montanilacus]|jgi:hypothetical protein|uniref:Uncharacterized protein n=1 Tax=Jezberella montanilacus TaxID=323426 RepID=A0A2T0XDN6_9BURK|nr:hypothetical protein [Jezberella montanilacus]PRY97043.1 hypothetical protein BCM14_2182 [Jezberella montanilacus]
MKVDFYPNPQQFSNLQTKNIPNVPDPMAANQSQVQKATIPAAQAAGSPSASVYLSAAANHTVDLLQQPKTVTGYNAKGNAIS